MTSLHPRALVAAFLVGATAVRAQDTTQKGVRIGLTYERGVRPRVAVLPFAGQHGDSLRVMIGRDLDFSDRIEVEPAGAIGAYEAASGGGTRPPNYGLWKTLGAAAVIQGIANGTGVTVSIHDVARARVAETREFALPGPATGEEWRMAVHGVSDEIERWITGTRGAAQSRILYVRNRQIYVIDSDGAGERALTQGATALSPSWHPSGRYIAYSTFGARGTEIHVRDLRDGTSRRLETASGLNITPEWSPDGQSIAYAHGQENGADLVLAAAFGDGAGARRITVGKGTDNTSPSFSPDGRRLAFTSGRSGHPEVYIADTDGASAELLTPFQFGRPSYRSSPSWSPDGRVVAFQTRGDGEFQVATIALRDRSMKQLTSEGVNEDPSWAPDGRHLVFTSSRSGVKQLWILDLETGRSRQLTRSSGGARLAAWSRILGSSP